jgi:alkyl hydroperoxide reductase subunit D
MTLSVIQNETPAAGLEALRDRLPDYAKDTRLNLGQVLTPEGAPDLTENQIAGIALASAYATRQPDVIAAIAAHTAQTLTDAEKTAAKAAASVMAMNNVYYRFLHLAGDAEFKTLPAKLRMNVIGQPGIAKTDFELYSLAISAINGCGMCIEAHTHELGKAGVSKLGIQSAVRIAAVLNAAAQSLV